jgi:hypothetical protein
MLKSDKNPPRALAYHYSGFMNLLLDGHHKACAAASLGKYVRCLTIIPADGCAFDFERSGERAGRDKQSNPFINTIRFAGLETEAEDGMRYLDIFGNRNHKDKLSPFQQYDLTGTRIHYGPDRYPKIRDIVILLDPGKDKNGRLPVLDQETLRSMINEDTADADSYLDAAIHYLASTDRDAAYRLASAIVKKGDDRDRHGRVRAALLYLLDCRSDETEQLLVDFYLNHEEQDENWHLVNSYWKN